MMQGVFVLDANQTPLMPCHPAKARRLLKEGRAKVYRHFPFTIILTYAVPEVQATPLVVKIDPGSKTTGMVIMAEKTDPQTGEIQQRKIFAMELTHRGQAIRHNLLQRRQIRRGRRQRKTRYRPARFLNRRRKAGWLPPSLQSRVDNVLTWVKRLQSLCPISAIALELVKFDTQALQNPEISGVEYQQGTLSGYEVREYLLEKWNRTCAYCKATNVPLEIEHLIPSGRGGSSRISNLAIACHDCNQKKGNQTAVEFGYPHLMALAKQPLQDAAAMNATRWAMYEGLKQLGLPLIVGTGGQTKYNRIQQNYPKSHWIDAACVGKDGANVRLDPTEPFLQVMATGRGSRQMCRMDRSGFPRTAPKSAKTVHGFRTGDLVRATVPKGKKQGTHTGRVAVRTKGSFRVGIVDGISWRSCTLLQRNDGYAYQKGEADLTPMPDGRGLAPLLG
jgi:5-methylcytosine-specific restriction endonuclease McrA